MNSQTKSAIKQLVLELRHTLEYELTIVQRRYGIFTDPKWSLDLPEGLSTWCQARSAGSEHGFRMECEIRILLFSWQYEHNAREV